MSDHVPDDCMDLSDLDGFLTGVVVGPELILPSEWLPVVWGGQEPEFWAEEEMRTVVGTFAQPCDLLSMQDAPAAIASSSGGSAIGSSKTLTMER
jgi:uncharacterized protein